MAGSRYPTSNRRRAWQVNENGNQTKRQAERNPGNHGRQNQAKPLFMAEPIRAAGAAAGGGCAGRQAEGRQALCRRRRFRKTSRQVNRNGAGSVKASPLGERNRGIQQR